MLSKELFTSIFEKFNLQELKKQREEIQGLLDYVDDLIKQKGG